MALDQDRDIITIKKLQLPYGIIAPNVWGEYKAQPVLLSLALTLNPGIGSAADKDALDQNTIHYGHLAKRIRGGASSDQTLSQCTAMVGDILYDMGQRDDHTFRLSESKMQLTFPKASMSGETFEIQRSATHGSDGTVSSPRTNFSICGMKVMTLIGVNANERQAKQPLLVGLELCVDSKTIPWDLDATARLFGVEHSLVQVRCQTFAVNAVYPR